MRDLLDAPADAVAVERARVATEGWGARLLAEQGDDGRWDGGVYRPGWVDERRPFFDAWTATHFSLQQLRDLGVPHAQGWLFARALDPDALVAHWRAWATERAAARTAAQVLAPSA